MRCPLGGLWRNRKVALALGCVTTLLSGCVTYRGKGYWAWAVPGWPVESTCEIAAAGESTAVRVVVFDEMDGALPGVTVRFSRPGSERGPDSYTNAHGVATISVERGEWLVRVNLNGFRKGQYSLSVLPDQSCTITFHLGLDSTSVITVT